MFRGLGNLIQIATETARASEDSTSGLLGVSVRVGRSPVRVAPTARPARPSTRHRPPQEDAREPAADVFDEDDHFVLIVQLPGAEESSIGWNLNRESAVTVRAESGGRAYVREIELAAPVTAANATMRYENGILELRLWKQR